MGPLPQPATTATAPKTPLSKAFKAFTQEWHRRYWLDSICITAMGGVIFCMHRVPIPVTRTFPITFDGSGNIVNPDLAYPARGWIIPTWLCGAISFVVPFSVYALAQIRIKSVWDANSAIVGTTWAITLATFFQIITKVFVGGFRPNFLDICMPDIARADHLSHSKTGLNGVGFHQIMYTVEVCTQEDAAKLRSAITSFPSGHSAVGFASFGFLFLWLNAKLKVWADHKPAFWKITATMLPVLFAFVNACILTVDAVHHWYDILAGSLIGVLMAVTAYRTTYAAVWDWRYNHLRLHGNSGFVYCAGETVDYKLQTLTKGAGWGGERERRRDDPNDTSIRDFAHQSSSLPEGDETTREKPMANTQQLGCGAE